MFNLDLDLALAPLTEELTHLGMAEARAAALAPAVKERLLVAVALHKKEFYWWRAGQWFINFDQSAAALYVEVRCEAGVTRTSYSL